MSEVEFDNQKKESKKTKKKQKITLMIKRNQIKNLENKIKQKIPGASFLVMS